MKRGQTIACFIMAVFMCAPPPVHAATVDFETLPGGTKYGASYGNLPGDVVLSQDGILVSVEEFFLGTFTGFVKAEVGGIYADFFPTTSLELNNISLHFDFSGVGFNVTSVDVEYKEFGGTNNVAVNGYTVHEVDPLTDLPAVVSPGITSSVNNGILTLAGDIDSFQIGGQELVIDNITAVPEPMTVVLLGMGAALTLARGRSRQGPRRVDPIGPRGASC